MASDCLIVQITDSDDRVDSLLELLRPFGIMEVVRTGHVAMMRGKSEGVRHTPGAGSNGSSNGHGRYRSTGLANGIPTSEETE